MTSTQDIEENIAKPITSIEFTMLTNSDIKRMSVVRDEIYGLTNPQGYDNQVPIFLGVLDPRLGVIDKEYCATCDLKSLRCPGHPGHIELAEPVYHIGYIDYLKKIMRNICIKCSKLLVHKNEKEIQDILKKKSNKKRFVEIHESCKSVSYCQTCGAPVPQIDVDKSTFVRLIAKHTMNNIIHKELDMGDIIESKKEIREILTPERTYTILRNISDLDCSIMGLNPEKCRPENMIIKYFHVPPVQIRPTSNTGNSGGNKKREDDLTHKISDIIKTNEKLRAQKGSTNQNEKYTEDLRILLTYHISTFYSNESTKMPKSEQRNGKDIISVTKRLKGKSGRFRENLEGKRVNFSARTVVDPDKDISIDEIGIPIKIAMAQSFPEKVTPLNIEYLTKLVENGTKIYPGANSIEHAEINKRTGMKDITDLKYGNYKRILKYGDVVNRHLINGDYVLFNRQPTLHRPSMMAHKVHVLPDPEVRSFRLNGADTKPYNADFDGDEMNIHVPQSIQASIELEMIATVLNQIISVGYAGPIIGLIQDGLFGGLKMTKNKDLKIHWRDVMNLILYTSKKNSNVVEKGKYYSGLELFSLILPDNLTMKQGELNIVNGQIKSGKITSKNIGTSKNNIIHKLWREMGPTVTKTFIDDAQRLTINWLLYSGYTMGPKDFYITKDCRDKLINIVEAKRLEINTLITEMENNPNTMNSELFESILRGSLQHLKSDQIEPELMKNLPEDNQLKICIESGSKGKPNNAVEIIFCAGQQLVEGIRAKNNFNGRALPYFYRGDDTASARGLCINSFLSGLTPTENFFHTQGGREGIVDTAVKTGDTGYIQRKLIKSLEDIYVAYDGTVRNANGRIIQFAYSGNNSNTEYQIECELTVLEMDNDTLKKKYNYTETTDKNYTKKHDTEFIEFLIKSRDELRRLRNKFYVDRIELITTYYFPFDIKYHINKSSKVEKKTKLEPSYVLEKIKEFLDNIYIFFMNKKQKKGLKYRDNEDSKLLLNIVIYEYLAPKRCIEEYTFYKENFDDLLASLKFEYHKSLIYPGEMVGILAAQSIGEPSTQMTLKSFHSAGTGKGAQSLGIPRLKEILGVSKKLKTPVMIIGASEQYEKNKDVVKKISSFVRHTTLIELVKQIDIIFDPEINKKNGITEVDGVENIFYANEKSSQTCTSDISNSPWLLRLEINKKEMIDKNITLLDIKSIFCYRWARRFEDSKKSKVIKKTILENVSKCSILSNYDNSPTPIIHIRFEFNNFDYGSLILLKDFIMKFKLKGIQNIDNITNVDSETSTIINDKGGIGTKEHYNIYTNGSNLIDLHYINGINYSTLITNDIIQIHKMYGIYAAKTALCKELRKVLQGGGSNVHPSHIILLADVMTNVGEIMAINRFGINKLDTDPLSKASFEEPIEQVTEAAVFNLTDYGRSISARVMMGKPILGGTGLCELIVNTEEIISFEKDNEVENKTDIVDFTQNALINDLFK